jgi:hypothetical protein
VKQALFDPANGRVWLVEGRSGIETILGEVVLDARAVRGVGVRS